MRQSLSITAHSSFEAQLLRILGFGRFIAFAPAEETSGYAGDDRVSWDVVGNDCAGANDGTFADAHAGKENGASADVGPFFYVDGLNFEVGFDDWPVVGNAGVG